MRYLLIFTLFLAITVHPQTKEQLIEKIKRGEIAVTPEMIQEGKASLAPGKSSPSHQKESPAVDKTGKSDTLVEVGAKTESKIPVAKKEPSLQDLYDSLIRYDLNALKLKVFG